MSKITIYHNNRCSKSREALALLEERNLDPEVRYYLKDAPSTTEITDLLKKLNMKPEDLIRKKETIYKENFKGKDLTEDEWITILSENPRLIERPIVINGDKAAVGRPTENIEEIL
ncbi:MAG TPA: arsenate reductase (glutaredoxin) [Flavobacteriaceae bacterium]|nr:arsenate reductase (glutaredoxin) [Flavobacteriaceae bacterium]